MVLSSPDEYEPRAHSPQPSVAVVEPSLSEVWPLGQFMLRHAVAVPPREYLPATQFVHPSSVVVEAVFVANFPAGQVCGVHVVKAPPTEKYS